MSKKIIILILGVAGVSFHLRGGIPEVLRSVEANNLTLQARRHSADAGSYEARMGNSLDDLSVSYSHLWGEDAAAGRTGELEVSQSFDFPTVYASRGRVAKTVAQQYDNEYMALRQEILLETKELCIELRSLRQTEDIMLRQLEANEILNNLYSARFESGDATLLDKTRINSEYLLMQEGLSECSSRIIEVSKRLETLNGGQPLRAFFEDEPFDELRPFGEVYADYGEYAPQLLAFRLRESLSDQELKLSRAQSLPKFEIGYKHEFAPGEKFNGVTAGISIPIFSNRYNVKRAKAVQAAAKIDMQAAEVESKAILSEMYEKATLLAASLSRYESLPDTDEYIAILMEMLDAGAINVVDYYAELNAFYDVARARIGTERDYRTLLARINAVYL